MRPYKGVTELLSAFAALPDADARLVIAGKALDDAYAARVTALAAADDRVRLDLGFVPDDELQVYLRAADVVATPFLEIFTSGSVLLAMSFGKAVIAPRRGCVAETVDERGRRAVRRGRPRWAQRGPAWRDERGPRGDGPPQRRAAGVRCAWPALATDDAEVTWQRRPALTKSDGAVPRPVGPHRWTREHAPARRRGR